MFTDPYSPVQTDYQRQQLNVLRKHQGLPPIPPGRRYIDFLEGLWSLIFRAFVSGALFVALALWFHPGYESAETNYETPTMAWWQIVIWLGAPLVLFLFLTGLRQVRLEEEYQRTLRRWEQAGRP